MSDAEEFCHQIVADALASDLAMTKHPFIAAVAAGTATREQLIEYGVGMYKLVGDAQRWTAAGYSQIDDHAVRAQLMQSMYEEETGMLSGSAAHSALVADLIAALGQSHEQTSAQARQLRPQAQAYCDFQEFLGRCRPFWLHRGVTSLAGEAQFTNLCKLMVDVLPRHYGVDEHGLRFWSVHIPIDEEHTSTAVRVVGPYVDDPEARRLIRHYVQLHMEMRYRAWSEPLTAAL
jgi:pyrroloquinoline quinone (PQQ) biosynthesis protein C